MDKIFNLQVESVADDDRVRRSDKLLLEHLIGIALKQVLPEAIVLKVSINQVTKKKKQDYRMLPKNGTNKYITYTTNSS